MTPYADLDFIHGLRATRQDSLDTSLEERRHRVCCGFHIVDDELKNCLERVQLGRYTIDIASSIANFADKGRQTDTDLGDCAS